MMELPGLSSVCRMQSSRHWFTVSWIRPSPTPALLAAKINYEGAS